MRTRVSRSGGVGATRSATGCEMRPERQAAKSKDFAERGSQRWLQLAIDRFPDVLRNALSKPLALTNDDDTYKVEPVPGKQQVTYGFGGTQSLAMREVFAGNIGEFERTVACLPRVCRRARRCARPASSRQPQRETELPVGRTFS